MPATALTRLLAAGAAVTALAAVLTACSSGGGASSSDGRISVVASTDVWGDVVKQIAGDSVDVTSIIDDPSADPHSYEASAQTQLAISRAAVVVANGGGYDDFVDTMLKSSKSHATVIDAVDISGKKASQGDALNEHVWYDFPTVAKVAASIADELRRADPSNAATFTANETTFDAALTTLETSEAAIKATHAGTGVAITEPVPLYLLDACGLVNRTPAEFSEGVEEGTDVPASVLADTLALFDDKKVALLAYNEQTSGAETDRVLAAAKSNNVAVVPVTETLPSGKDYLTWMTDNVAAVRSALGS